MGMAEYDALVQARVTRATRDKLRRVARGDGLTIGTYLRRLILAHLANGKRADGSRA